MTSVFSGPRRWKATEDSRYLVSDFGEIYSTVTNIVMKATTAGNGGYKLIPCVGKVHRAVAEAFIPNPQRLPFVLHLDDNPLNNWYGNLRWGMHQDNMDDRGRNGNHTTGQRSSLSRYTEDDVRRCHQGYAHFSGSMHAYARHINKNREWVRQILKGERWKHLNLPAYD